MSFAAPSNNLDKHVHIGHNQYNQYNQYNQRIIFGEEIIQIGKVKMQYHEFEQCLAHLLEITKQTHPEDFI